MNWTLEVVIIPVSDVDRAKAFYSGQLGFNLDFDHRPNDALRVIQLTPPGSGCSIQLGQGITTMAAGSLQGLQLVVHNLKAAHGELVGRGVAVSEIQVFDRGGKQRPSREGDDLDNAGFVYFKDPDGNGWAVQQISSRS
jgi:catechol 2,3-dioxygenase-like lactoylglutathione lyase family enzyme